ncbi:calcineurin-like phosphoesterase family protein [Bradyrhizobium huanghuaihaiense]|uniref:Calcineurin-like phosphoesterase family protein n=1 Tax=Bradyrhizobium huanghuaihaiense TaxID=990078 RepID=A0A562RN98_9BRAD|nr:metallophosphoesterase [Bradyrhizobium huanghuaihaiense]TWI70531.1 calcineurin-like phosphoesterase family protein [Bradyrhizobium huanghuaihaiense]
MSIRLHAVSDLHDDIAGNQIGDWPVVDADVIVVAGDAMAPGSHALRLVRRLYPETSIPLVYVPGNHDFYSENNPKIVARDPSLKTTWEAERERMRDVAAALGISLLDDDVDVFDVAGEQVRVIGSTLWSSFKARPPHMMWGDAAEEARRRMNDYSMIKTGRGRGRDKLRPGDTVDAHKRSVAFIEQTLAMPFDGATVVVTHMCPSYRSLSGWDPEKPRGFQQLDYCYASDLEHLMTGDTAPELWLHGHVHRSLDYSVGDVRVLCNPRGYPAPGGRENPDFDQALVVEVERRPTPGWRL